ncbi:MAG: FkbM family methyltransferase [Gemmataceae bacterium]|nr:FkbM family methyltransferase [Gemmataceae bacterium]
MTPLALLKPWYVYHPRQVLRRLKRAIRPPADPVQVVGLPWGCPLEIDIRETIGRSVWTAGVYDLAVCEVLHRAADPALLALDVGANIGAMTGLLATRAAEVWAFEPYPPVLDRLRRNVSQLAGRPGFARCIVHPVALSDHAGEVVMECPDGFDGNQGLARVADPAPSANGTNGAATPGRVRVAVRAATLDELLGERQVGVMKLDVEGHELAVLQGACAAIGAGRVRSVVFEDHVGPDGPVAGFLREQGYEVLAVGWELRGPVLRAAGESAHQSYEAPSYLATRDPGVIASARPRGWRCLGGGR